MTKSPAKQSSAATPSFGPNGRAVGLDVHPDTFAAAIMHGRDPLTARVQHSVTRQPLDALCAWAARHTTQEDVLVIEASANTFAVGERLTALGRQVFILESHRAGQIGQSYLANDRNDAAKIARIYLSGLAIKVWAPDPETRQRRELLSVYQRCIKDCTRARQHLRSFLNEHALRLPAGFRICRPHSLPRVLGLKDWSPRQKLLLQEMHGSLVAARRALAGGANQAVIGGTSVLNAPHGLAVDTVARKVYWADTGQRGSATQPSARKVSRCNFDGTDYVNLTTTDGTNQPWDLTLDLSSSTYADWAMRFFPAAAGMRLALEDADGDGVVNLLEYAFDGNPLAGAPVTLPGPRANGMGVQFPRRRISPLAYRVEVSTDLLTWRYNGDGLGPNPTTETSVNPVDAEMDLVTVAATVSGPKMFFRVRVTTTEP